MGLPRQEYWSRLPFPFPGDLSNPEIKPVSPACRQIFYHWATRGDPFRLLEFIIRIGRFSKESVGIFSDTSMKVKVKSLSSVQHFATPWTVAHQAPLSMGLPRQEYWSRLPFPSPGDPPDPGIEPASRVSYIAGGFFTNEPRGKPWMLINRRQLNTLRSTHQCCSLARKR